MVRHRTPSRMWSLRLTHRKALNPKAATKPRASPRRWLAKAASLSFSNRTPYRAGGETARGVRGAPGEARSPGRSPVARALGKAGSFFV